MRLSLIGFVRKSRYEKLQEELDAERENSCFLSEIVEKAEAKAERKVKEAREERDNAIRKYMEVQGEFRDFRGKVEGRIKEIDNQIRRYEEGLASYISIALTGKKADLSSIDLDEAHKALLRAHGNSLRDIEGRNARIRGLEMNMAVYGIRIFSEMHSRFARMPFVIFDGERVRYSSANTGRYDIDDADFERSFSDKEVVKELDEKKSAKINFGNCELNVERVPISEESFIDVGYLVPAGKRYARRRDVIAKRAMKYISSLGKVLRLYNLGKEQEGGA